MTQPNKIDVAKINEAISTKMNFCGAFENLREMKKHVGRQAGNYGICPIKDGEICYVYNGTHFNVMYRKTILKLVLKKEWYDMIDSGFKKEEYRVIKPYWDKILNGHTQHEIVRFYLGYSKNRPQMTFRIKSIEKGIGQEVWGAEPGKEYYVIKLGERI